MSIALQAAEAACERVSAVQPNINQEAYEFTLDQLKGLAVTAKDTYGRWKQWAPPETQKELQSHVRGLELQVPLVVSRKADFIQATIKKDTERQDQVGATSYYCIPTIMLKPTALPKFGGIKRDFHRWKKDWEALQSQGEPTGSN